MMPQQKKSYTSQSAKRIKKSRTAKRSANKTRVRGLKASPSVKPYNLDVMFGNDKDENNGNDDKK